MNDDFIDEPLDKFGEEEQLEEEQLEEEFDSPSWEIEFDEELMMDNQEEYENEYGYKPSDEWMEIIDTEEGLDAELLQEPSPYDNLEEPFWEQEEEDQRRVDDAKKTVDEHLNPSEQDDEQWSPPNLKTVKKKKKEKKSDKKDRKKNIKAKPKSSITNALLASTSSVPKATTTQSQKKLPNEQKKTPAKQTPSPKQPQQSKPASGQTALSAARPSHADKPGTPITLPIASPLTTLDTPTNSPSLGYPQDLEGLGQIGVFSNDGGLSHLNHRMDSFTVLLTFIFIAIYTRTS
jgi:hypothetical protein